MEYIKSSPLLRLIGTPSTGVWDRVAQVSFLHTKLGASEVVAQLNKAGICCRNGPPPRFLIQAEPRAFSHRSMLEQVTCSRTAARTCCRTWGRG